MPYKKKTMRKRRRGRFSKRRSSLKNKVSKLTKFVYRTIEPKQVTRFVNATAQGLSSTSWFIHDLTEMQFAVGSENNERIGNSVTIQSIKMRMMFKNMIPSTNIRCLVIQFPNEQLENLTTANPLGLPLDIRNMSAILQWPLFDPLAPPVSQDENVTILSQYKVGSNTKFKVLHDKVYSAPGASYVWNPTSSALSSRAGLNRVVNLNCTPRGAGKVLSFKVGATQQFAVKNRVLAFFINNAPQGTSERSPIGISSRMTYRDA
ncbi:MAG: putative capsid protein [Cressdnaviricota sp.]|nr:MAG: putative capsid protein [Cressdnaviricota sp.]